MYTICPGCTRQFEIHEEHLAAASGQVRCGFCHELFNAMERLHDAPLSNEKILSDQLGPDFDVVQKADGELQPEPEQTLEEEPQFDIPAPVEDVLINTQETDTGQELETAISEIGIRPSVYEIKTKLKKEISEVKEAQSNLEPEFKSKLEAKPELEAEPLEDSIIKAHYDFPNIPEVLLEETPVKKNWSWISPFFWTTGSVITLLILIAQLAWFSRDKVFMEYPQFVPYAKQMCQELGCRIIRERDVRAITLVNRDVRLHPDYQDSLLVNAAMKNELSVRQPYPRVQLTLFDTSGSLLGHREFVPDDYLDSSIEIDEGMPIDSPVYFVLEVSGPTAGAVSFEFRFL
ncbi:MAG: zinc-ribbon and DUF3426 domain-containing protein [Gammaproteobacteria bacterium]|jgi:predicted Zn finger-like uncharacterized protein